MRLSWRQMAVVLVNLIPTLVWAETSEMTAIRVDPGKAQLFVDDYLIGSQSDLRRTLRQPRKDDGGNAPIIALEDLDPDLHGTLEANGSIFFDTRLKKYVMFAIAFVPLEKGENRVQLFRFTSRDGMNWTKGDDGQTQRIHVDLTNAAGGRSAMHMDLFSCFYDEADAAYPYKGWVFLWGEKHVDDETSGLYYIQSADGRTWQRGSQIARAHERHIQQDGRELHGIGDVTVFTPDAESGRFLGLLRFMSPTPIGDKNHLRSRAFAFVDRLDARIDVNQIERVDLVPAAAASESNGDLPDDQYYGSTAWRYGSMWIGGLRVWHGGGDYPYSANGCAFLKLISSRDGLHWNKVSVGDGSHASEVFVPNGPEGDNNGQNDGGYMTEFSTPPLRIGDELIMYYGSSSWGKNHAKDKRVTGGGIFRARLRPDGFVSVDSGTLTTKPLAFDGEDLLVNGIGPIRVEVLGADGNAVAQATVHGDSLKHKVSFDGGRSLGDVAKGQAQLRFTVDADDVDGRLYSFTIGE